MVAGEQENPLALVVHNTPLSAGEVQNDSEQSLDSNKKLMRIVDNRSADLAGAAEQPCPRNDHSMLELSRAWDGRGSW
jgi:hypothetical protein